MNENENPLGVKPISKLLPSFAIPSVIAMLVTSLYNIVDQLFIGQMVGTLGNAATNIAFPLTTSSIAIALMFGIGSSACFNLHMGMGRKKEAPFFIGNAVTMLLICGVALMVVTEIFLTPMLLAFGSAGGIAMPTIVGVSHTLTGTRRSGEEAYLGVTTA